MSNRLLAFVGVFLTLILFFWRASMAGEILRNSGAEEMLGKSSIAWYCVGLFPGVKFNLDREIKYSGNISLAISCDDPSILKKFGSPYWAQEVTEQLPRGKKIKLTAYVKTRDVSEHADIEIQCWDSEKQKIVANSSTELSNPLRGTTDWTVVSCSLNVPIVTDKIRVLCKLSGTGAAWFDEIHLMVDGR